MDQNKIDLEEYRRDVERLNREIISRQAHDRSQVRLIIRLLAEREEMLAGLREIADRCSPLDQAIVPRSNRWAGDTARAIIVKVEGKTND